MTQLTVATLKVYLQEQGQPATGRKTDLINAVEEYLDRKGV